MVVVDVSCYLGIDVIYIYNYDVLMDDWFIILIVLMISRNNCNSIVNSDDNSEYCIVCNTWYDFIYKFHDLRFSNNMNIMIMCKI